MSTAAPVLEYEKPAEPAPGPEPRDEPKQSFFAWFQSHFWAISDQVLISGSNFATAVLTARALDKDEFGVFSIIYAFLLLANIFQTTLITQAHNVIGSSRDGNAYRRYTASSLVGQILMIVMLASLAGFLALVGWIGGWSSAAMLLALGPAIVGWQLQEFVRRVLYTEHRHGAAFLTDFVAYGGQIALLVALYSLHFYHGWSFTGATALYVLGGCCAAGAILGFWQIRKSLSWPAQVHDLFENWHFGKWLLGGDLMGYCSQIHMQVLWAAWILGVAASANLRAAQILFGPTRVIAFFLGTVLPIRFARTLHTDGMKAMSTQIRRLYIVLVPAVGAYCLLMALYPKPLLQLIYRKEYADSDAALVLALYSLCAFISYMQMVVAAALMASRQTRHIFAANVWGCIIALIASPICIKLMGSVGGIVGMLLTTLVVTALFVRAYLRTRDIPTAEEVDAPPMDDEASAVVHEGVTDPRGILLSRVIELFDRNGVSWCVLHGHEKLPYEIQSDVDCMMPRAMLPQRLGEMLLANEAKLGARIVQWFDDGAHFIVLETPSGAMLQLHVSTSYNVEGHELFSGDEVLSSRRRARNGIWIPGAEIEFAAVLANRLGKGKIDERHTSRLTELWHEAPQRCRVELDRLLPPENAAMVQLAAESGDWQFVLAVVDALQDALLTRLAQGHPLKHVNRWIVKQAGRAVRWVHPQSGLHVVFLGPDGAGKSTVIDGFKEVITPAFMQTNYQTFARGILPTKPKSGPHSLKPRSVPESLVKAAWWLLCYSIGYFKSTWPTLARGGLAINHRYLIDAVVDPTRYRYSASTKIVRWIWAVVPKPHLIIFLDAPAEVIAARKQEVPASELAKFRDGYLALAKTLPNAHVVTTNQPIEQSVADVKKIVLDYMAARMQRRIGVEETR